MSLPHRPIPLTHLSACIAAIWGLCAVPISAGAATRVVSNCADDNSTGSLRKVVQAAQSGDVIDLTSLSCSLITLKLGVIPIPLNNLTLQGPSSAHLPLTISGNSNYRVLDHSTLFGMGTLSIEHLTIESGKYMSTSNHAHGGCIYSNSDVALNQSTVTLCTARQQSGSSSGAGARGGGIYALGTVTLLDSTILQNTAISVQDGYTSLGGGIFAGKVNAYYSTISANKAVGGTGALGGGGGIVASGGTISASTIDSNLADYGAGITLFGITTVSIVNSTISSNIATSGPGGIAVYFQQALQVNNSTIAFNQSPSGTGGVALSISNPLSMHSTLIAENTTVSGNVADLHTASAPISGAHNIVMHADTPLPGGFAPLNGNPKLGALGYRGGTTRTHALSTGSIAIDQGDNLLSLFDDQRGIGYARNVGFTFGIDIGAYERQENDDEIFGDGF